MSVATGRARHQNLDTTPSIEESVTVRRLGKHYRVARSADMMSRTSKKSKKRAPVREQNKIYKISITQENKMSIPQINEDEEQILRCAIVSYGEMAQEDMLFEEMSELEKAILKLRRTRYMDESKRADVIEELADVYIMITQMYMRFCCTKEEKALFGVSLHKKIERLSQYIKREFP